MEMKVFATTCLIGRYWCENLADVHVELSKHCMCVMARLEHIKGRG